MPTKAYCKFLSNMETVHRLEGTYDEIRRRRNHRGRAAYDHITRSAVIFLVSAFEVYIEDVIKEGAKQHIVFSKDGKNLPGHVQNTINQYVKVDTNATPPMFLCDEGWREVYKTIVENEMSKLNTPSKKQIVDKFDRLLGIKKSSVEKLRGIDDLECVISFRGEIAHRVKASQYVSIEQVHEKVSIICNLTVEIDKMILKYFKNTYQGRRLPWNNTY